MWSMFLLYLPAMTLASFLLLPGYDSLMITVALTWMVAYVIAGIYLACFRCPQCRKFFFIIRWSWSNPFARKCLNCGLRKGWLPDEGQSST